MSSKRLSADVRECFWVLRDAVSRARKLTNQEDFLLMSLLRFTNISEYLEKWSSSVSHERSPGHE